MPRFFFHVSNGHGLVPDDEGLDLESQTAAKTMAIDSIRSMVSEDSRNGVIDLTGRIDVTDGDKNLLTTVPYFSAFAVRIPEDKADAYI